MLNLTPILKRDQPTSRIEIGAKKVGPNTDTVEIRHNGTRAFFYVDPVEDSIVDGIANKVRTHQNVTTVFGGIDRGKDFLVDPDATKHDVVECSSATIHTGAVAPDDLEPFLRENEYLLHRMAEVAPKGDTLATFEVVDMTPTDHTTLRVTPDTEFEFVEIDDADLGDDSVVQLSPEPDEPPERSASDAHETEEMSIEEAVYIVDRFDGFEGLGEIASQIAGVGRFGDEIEQTTDDEIASLVDDVLSDLEGVSAEEIDPGSTDDTDSGSDFGDLSMGDDTPDEIDEPVAEERPEEIEGTPDHEVASMVDDILADVETVGETAQQTADDEATESDDDA